MNTYLIVFFLQAGYMLIKVVGVRVMVGGAFRKRLIITNIASVVWLASTSIGVVQVSQEDYWVFLPYVLGSSLGIIIENRVRRYI